MATVITDKIVLLLLPEKVIVLGLERGRTM